MFWVSDPGSTEDQQVKWKVDSGDDESDDSRIRDRRQARVLVYEYDHLWYLGIIMDVVLVVKDDLFGERYTARVAFESRGVGCRVFGRVRDGC